MQRRKVKRIGSSNSKKVYIFLKRMEEQNEVFQFSDLQKVSGWTKGTIEQYLSTRLRQFVRQTELGYSAFGCKDITSDHFCRLMSQSIEVARDPLRPWLPPKSEALLTKARETALAAIQHYNNPNAIFRSGNYIICQRRLNNPQFAG